MEKQSLDRYTTAQERDFPTALTEISYGRKQTHWMWYIFPQIQGLGSSEAAKFYAIKDLKEAANYLMHPVLGPRLVKISKELLRHQDRSAYEIFGSPDDLKLRSCMTLFAAVPNADPVFQQVLDQFFDGEKDPKTQRILGLQP
ncbi:DUF1810 domain-containing protein [Pedobacter ginsengisoli]|uniref:DUF1810 domain-containing protein n=1 Tax=Pedobacter ginsengisoli TaxID=363852 RepID=UPI00254A29D9|nr:DUF1810 domain-containing protein [Pedobacter ginsengisoli]